MNQVLYSFLNEINEWKMMKMKEKKIEIEVVWSK